MKSTVVIAALVLALAPSALAQKRRAPKPKAPAVVAVTTPAPAETPKPKRTPKLTANADQNGQGVVLWESSVNALLDIARRNPTRATPSSSATVAGDASAGNAPFDRSRGISHRGRPSAGRSGQTSSRRTH